MGLLLTSNHFPAMCSVWFTGLAKHLTCSSLCELSHDVLLLESQVKNSGSMRGSWHREETIHDHMCIMQQRRVQAYSRQVASKELSGTETESYLYGFISMR